ncbi:MAG: hypothetical protein A3C02_04625 [Candidatus Andersenbacteria bacterium RIFCSPHIGHO2_02_FULL_45_11]|uniref:Glycosyltransferase subfamily 4-like N-terminal domain-containing protein n=1 Tax=Candidatus Andersenbacteria bacterium RIFCSPHIGHO2_12_FULL_45_11 TaxID=1797281 RepID=A0A1G1X4D6_9BACT|nr:MAG: hypothetical protein A2805_00190 [Candidatus Andersenbacteria bacterium RIFCSPHIGHO2_01_FULL_46_36]OGY32253.1 MAG: hypothetical protein A3C02_04625 [Candidatus Andersenbacteria bacterium RIFCSPHIGHO2_02_FULL_45_11]OGY34187.1 MAG: hypothetical protein A3D99_00515 [Candidatus Andersenbacteria bacterium RIFCSPHIGHO2_12_FULL_45_11]
MRILFISRAYSEHAGGMERLSFELIGVFRSTPPPYQGGDRGGLSVTTIVNETNPGASLLSTRLQSIIFALSVLPKALVASKNADIVHIGDPVLSFVGWCIARMRHIPVIVTVHGLDVSYPSPLYQLYLRTFFRSFSGYIAISEHAKKLMQRHRVRGSIFVIPPGIRDDIYSNTYTRNDLGKLVYRNISNRIVFATTGRLVARKGHAWFIKNVMTKLPRTVLYAIAGDGPQREHISLLIKSLKMEDRVIMLGRISHEDKKILLNTIDAFIQPNIPVVGDAEGFGIAPVEAALCARTVFASNIDGIPSAIHNGKNGTLIPPKETTAWVNILLQYMQHPLSHEPSGKDARSYTAENFSWDKIAQEYKKAFDSIA